MPTDIEQLQSRLEELERKVAALESEADQQHPFHAIRTLHKRLRQVEESILARIEAGASDVNSAPSPQSLEDPDGYTAPGADTRWIEPPT